MDEITTVESRLTVVLTEEELALPRAAFRDVVERIEHQLAREVWALWYDRRQSDEQLTSRCLMYDLIGITALPAPPASLPVPAEFGPLQFGGKEEKPHAVNCHCERCLTRQDPAVREERVDG